MGKRMKIRLPQRQGQQCRAYVRPPRTPYCLWRLYLLVSPTVFQAFCAGRSAGRCWQPRCRRTRSTSETEQGRPVSGLQLYNHSTQALLAKVSLQRTAMKKTKKIQEMRAQVSCRLNTGTSATSIIDAAIHKTPQHKMAKRQSSQSTSRELCCTEAEAEQGGVQ